MNWLYIFRRRELERANGYLDVVTKEVVRQRYNFLWPCGTPHECLPIWPDLAHNFRS